MYVTICTMMMWTWGLRGYLDILRERNQRTGRARVRSWRPCALLTSRTQSEAMVQEVFRVFAEHIGPDDMPERGRTADLAVHEIIGTRWDVLPTIDVRT